MSDMPDVLIAYGQSDEYSFVVRKDTGNGTHKHDVMHLVSGVANMDSRIMDNFRRVFTFGHKNAFC
jgi:tRNA(His) 5'-end guanylyltransferase